MVGQTDAEYCRHIHYHLIPLADGTIVTPLKCSESGTLAGADLRERVPLTDLDDRAERRHPEKLARESFHNRSHGTFGTQGREGR